MEVLVVDGDPSVQKGMAQLLAPAGLSLTTTPSQTRALELVTAKFFGVVIIDLDTPGPGGGIPLVHKVRERSPATLVIVLTSRKSFDGAVLAFRAGADDVVMKAPDQVDYLKTRILAAEGDTAPRGVTAELLGDAHDTMEELVARLTEAERRALDLEDRAAGRDVSRPDLEEDVRVLVVDADDTLHRALEAQAAPGFRLTYARSAGEALDRVSTSRFDVALVAEGLPDLTGSMVARALKAQAPDLIVLAYQLGGRLDLVEGSRAVPLIEAFHDPAQLGERLGDLATAHRMKGRERRHLAAVRERHYELLRRVAELRRRIEKARPDPA